MPTQTQARDWLDRWDRQQERYVADREERFRVIGDVLAEVLADVERPTVLDLGAGPGSLSVRLLRRFPGAQLVAIDADPLLLGLARSAYGDLPGLHIVEHDLRDPGWTDALGETTFDAVVSTTALHWLTRDELAAVHRRCAGLVRAGGVFVDGDNFHTGDNLHAANRLDALARRVTDSRAARLGVLGNEEWAAWWAAVADAPELADLTAARGARPVEHDVPDLPSLDDHLALLRAAGFAEAGTVWQHGTDRVLVAVR